MLRHLTGHQVNGCNELLKIGVLDEPGPGGANRKYVLYVPHDEFNEELNAAWTTHLSFQDGPPATVGTNGVTHESLLAVLIDRLEGFQRGKFACEENAEALCNLRAAQDCLKSRTEKRRDRGVEGTLTV